MSTEPKSETERKLNEARLNEAVAVEVAQEEAAAANAERVRANSYATRAALANEDVREARVNEAVAQDVAVGMAVEADREALRREQVARQRDTAVVGEAVARQDAQRSATGFWILLGIIGISLLTGLLWYLNKNNTSAETAPTTVITRDRVVVPAATPTPTVNTQIVPVPAPPVVITQPVPVDRPVYIPVPVQGSGSTAAPAPTATSAPPSENLTRPTTDNPPAGQTPENSGSTSGGSVPPLGGYVEPTTTP